MKNTFFYEMEQWLPIVFCLHHSSLLNAVQYTIPACIAQQGTFLAWQLPCLQLHWREKRTAMRCLVSIASCTWAVSLAFQEYKQADGLYYYYYYCNECSASATQAMKGATIGSRPGPSALCLGLSSLSVPLMWQMNPDLGGNREEEETGPVSDPRDGYNSWEMGN